MTILKEICLGVIEVRNKEIIGVNVCEGEPKRGKEEEKKKKRKEPKKREKKKMSC